ncbi:MAG: FeoB-associated Cys-rich membrane protein [Pseudoflavonifractor sp.]
MKYVIYIAMAALVVWAVVYLARNIRRQMQGKCSGCGGHCDSCHGCNEK